MKVGKNLAGCAEPAAIGRPPLRLTESPIRHYNTKALFYTETAPLYRLSCNNRMNTVH